MLDRAGHMDKKCVGQGSGAARDWEVRHNAVGGSKALEGWARISECNHWRSVRQRTSLWFKTCIAAIRHLP